VSDEQVFRVFVTRGEPREENRAEATIRKTDSCCKTTMEGLWQFMVVLLSPLSNLKNTHFRKINSLPVGDDRYLNLSSQKRPTGQNLGGKLFGTTLWHHVQRYCSLGVYGRKDGAVVRALASHQCVSDSIPRPGVIGGLSLLLVLFLASWGFSPGTPVFPSPQKPTFPNSNSIWNCQALYHEPLPRVIAQALPVFDIKFAFTFFLRGMQSHIFSPLNQNSLLFSF